MKKRICFVVLLISFCVLTDGAALNTFNAKDCLLTFINCAKEDTYPIQKWYFSIENNNENEIITTLSILKNKMNKFPDLKCDIENCYEKKSFEGIFPSDMQRKNDTAINKKTKTGKIFIRKKMKDSNKYKLFGVGIPEGKLVAHKNKGNASDKYNVKINKDEEIVNGEETKNGTRSKRRAADCTIKGMANSFISCTKYSSGLYKCKQKCGYGHAVAHDKTKRKRNYRCKKNKWKPEPLIDCKRCQD
nr:uncharacterized protein LOC107451392 isoform X2 [Parasteatoda tepidariorum]